MEETQNQLKDTKGKNVFVYEDKEYHSNMLDNLNMLRKNRQFCDVILQVGNSQDIHEIYAHKVVLSSASPYFLEMFSNDMINSNGSSVPSSTVPQQYRLVNSNHQQAINGTNGQVKSGVTREEFDPEAFDQIIDYAYTARLQVPAEKVREIYAIASRLKMTSVAGKCGQFLLSTLTPENCLEVRNMKAVLKDPFLLQSVDGYIKQNFEAIVKNKSSTNNYLLQLKIDFLLNSDQEEKLNERHVFNEVLEWIHACFEQDALDLTTLAEKKMFMLYFNKNLNRIQDCSEMAEPHSPEELEAIEDYKKLSKRLSHPNLIRSTSSIDNINININGVPSGKDKSSVPSKPRQFLFARSDSESSLSSLVDNDEEQEWKFLANCRIGDHTLAGLATISGQLCLLILKLRVNSSKTASKDDLAEDYCLIPPMSSPRCAVGTAELGGKLFVCGGYDRGECLKTVEVYDTSINKWETLQNMQVPRGRFAIAVVDGNVYAVGGCDGQNELNSAEFYDSITLTWKLIQSAPVVRSNAGVCSMSSKIFVIGGWNGNRGLTRCDMYDPSIGQWSEVGHLHTGRYQTAVCTLNDVMYAVGGCDSWSCLNSVEAYINDSWKLVAPLQTSRRGCGVATYNGKIYAVGGHDGVHALCSVEVYDPVENQWSFGKPMTVARANVGVAVVGTRLYAVGGFNGKTFLNTIEYFDFETEEWTTSVPINKDEQIANLTNGAVHHFNGTSNTTEWSAAENGITHLETSNENNFPSLHKHALNGKVQLKNSLSSEPLVEVEETIVGH